MPRTILLVGAPSFNHVQQAYSSQAVTSKQIIKPRHEPSLTATTSLASETASGPAAPSLGNTPRTDVGLPELRSFQAELPLDSQASEPEWRIVPLKSERLATNLAQTDWLLWTPLERARHISMEDSALTDSHSEQETEVGTSFATETDEDFEQSKSGQHGEVAFLERSFALHCDSDAPVTPAASFSGALSSFDPSLSTTSSSRTDSPEPPSSPLAPKSARKGHAQPEPLNVSPLTQRLLRELPTPISSLPSAHDVLRANPSTLTVSLLVGVMVIKSPRLVTIRKTGRVAELVEVVVSDETGDAGFGISFWLNNDSEVNAGKKKDAHPFKPSLRGELEDLHVGDIVIITNLAVSQWKGLVQGTSLARRTWRTSVSLAWRNSRGWTRLGRDLVTLSDTLDANRQEWRNRATSVKRWAIRNIVSRTDGKSMRTPRMSGGDTRIAGGRKRKFLPDDDTQE